MSVTFQVLEEHGLVYVEYGSVANVPDTQAAFSAFMDLAKTHPANKHLVDLSGIEKIEFDVPEFFKLQLKKVEGYLLEELPTLIVYYAPHEKARELAQLCKRSWQMIPSVVTVIVDDEAEALSLLGMSHVSIASMLEPASEIG